MTLYVVNVADPAAGADWQTMVPGPYLWNVTSIAGRLDTGTTPPDVLADASGNGNDGHIDVGPKLGVLTNPGLVAGDTSAYLDNLTAPTAYPVTLIGNPANQQGYFTLGRNWALTFWWKVTNAAQDIRVRLRQGIAPTDRVDLLLNAGGAGSISVTWQSGKNAGTVAGVLGNPLVAHRFTISVAAGVISFYADGVNIPTGPQGGVIPLVGDPNVSIFLSGGVGNYPIAQTFLDELAIYNHPLTLARDQAQRAAAAVSFAAYKAAVLADAPVGYYHLDGLGIGTGRQVALDVTDGTHIVAELASGFPAVATPGPYGYTWLPGASSNSETANGQIVTVALPRLVLPAGYTVGTFTPDLAPGDQWTDIAVWWSDDAMQLTAPVDPYLYPPGALLEYHQRTVTP